MKSRDIFLPSLSGVLVAGMIAFLSCAHQNRSDEDVYNDEASFSEADTNSDSSSSEQASNSNEAGDSSNSEPLSEQNSLEGPLADNKNTTEAEPIDSLEKELELESLSTDSKQDPLANNTQNPTTSNESSFENELESDAPSAPPSSSPEEGATANGAVIGSAAEGSKLESELESVEPIQPKTDELAAKDTITPEMEPLSQETLNLEKRPAKRSGYVASNKVPKIPAKAITRKGVKLNRFYFVRNGDTPQNVSSLIYGSPEKAKQLTRWNGKNWGPGKILYYASAKNPKDSKMDSFYKENDIVAEEYLVTQGDWLSKIAQKKLGSPKSWTEIAVINGIKSPKKLEVEQKIAIYPKDLTVKPVETVIAKSEPVIQQPVETQPVQPPPVVEPPPVQEAQIEEPPPIAVESKKESVKSSPVGFDIQKIIEQNMFAGLMGLAGFLLLILLVVKKRRKAKDFSNEGFEESEDGFQPPTKLKRK